MNVYTGIPAAEGIACALAVVVKEIIPETVTVSLDEAVEQCLKEIRHLREKRAQKFLMPMKCCCKTNT